MCSFRNTGMLVPLTAVIIAFIRVTWVTFVLCFMFIFLGAPYIEYLWGNRSLSTTLSAITAAVVGVILNLAVWFAAYTAYDKVNTFTGFGLECIVPRSEEWCVGKEGVGPVGFRVLA